MNIRDRLMSRASVAAMAAMAPKDESTLPAGAERVEDTADSGGSENDLGLSADEAAAFEAMQAGKDPGDKEDIVQGDTLEADADGPAPNEEDFEVRDDDGDIIPAGKDDAPAADGTKPPPRSVSYSKHQRELAKLKKDREELQSKLDGQTKETAREREERIKLNERTRLLLEAINTKAAPAPEAKVDTDPEPNEDEDPIGHGKWENRQLRKRLEAVESGSKRQQEETAAEREERQVYSTYESDLLNAAKADETFGEAFNYLRESRYTELGFIFTNGSVDINDKAAVDAALSPQQQSELSRNIQQTFHNEQMLIARQSLQEGRSPAAVVRSLARARGFQPRVPAAAQEEVTAAPPAKPGNGAPPAPRAAPATVKDQLQAIRDGQESSRSLSDAGGSPGGSITPERLAEMPDDEFEEFYSSMSKGKFDRIMGKPAQQ